MNYQIIDCSRLSQQMFIVEISNNKGEVVHTSEPFHLKDDAEMWGIIYLEENGDIDFSEEPNATTRGS